MTKAYRVYYSARVYTSVVVDADSIEEAEQIAEGLADSLETTGEVGMWQVDFAEEEDE